MSLDTQMQAVLAEYGITLGPVVTISTLSPGTLACKGTNGDQLVMLENDGEWGYFNAHRTGLSDFNGAWQSCQVQVVVGGVPPDVWSALRNEPSNIERVRIAAASIGLVKAPRADTLAPPPTSARLRQDIIATASVLGLKLGAPIAAHTMPPGTLALEGCDDDRNSTMLALMEGDGNWAYLINGTDHTKSEFGPGGRHQPQTVLVTGIPSHAWPLIRAEKSQLERVRIAASAVEAAKTKRLTPGEQRKQNIATAESLGLTVGPLVQIDTLPTGTLALSDHTGNLVLVENNGCWGYLSEGASSEMIFTKAYGSQLAHALCSGLALADSVPFVFDETYDGWCGSVRSLVGDILGCLKRDVHVRCVTADRSAVVQAPISLRTFQVAPGTSLCVEIDVNIPLGSRFRQEALAATIARGMRMRNRKVDNVYVTQRNSSQDAACELTPPKPRQ